MLAGAFAAGIAVTLAGGLGHGGQPATGHQAGAAPEGATTQPAGDADALRLELARKIMEHTAPPVGTVIAYWGSKADIKDTGNYELCDGELVSTLGSKIFGKPKPDLRNKFVRGYGGDENMLAAIDDESKKKFTGGSDKTPAISLGKTAPHQLTPDQMPRHSHPHTHFVSVIGESGDHYLGDRPELRVVTTGRRGADSKYALAGVGGTPNAGRTDGDNTPAGGNGAHSHDLPAVPEHDNVPAYVGLYYIIRVK